MATNIEPIVRTKQGYVEGRTSTDCQGRTFYSFQGLPYAQPPVGPLRFKAPRPPTPWTGIRLAKEEGNISFCRNFATSTIIGSEDSLYLNVYTPEISEDNLKPVMFFIHGGAFIFGSGNTDLHGPEFLVARDVLLVTINYRLGVLGFFCLDDPAAEMSGNAGLKDQVMALKWVQQNISKFGGDPKNVTIFGTSAGGASVHLLVLSPMARGLFHRAIIQSGCALNPWTMTPRHRSKMLLKHLGCDSDDLQTILKFLREINAEKVLRGQEHLSKTILTCSECNPIGPTIENSDAYEPTFLFEDPKTIIKQGTYSHVPLMIGSIKGEGMLFFLPFLLNVVPSNFTDYEDTIPITLKVKQAQRAETGKKIKEYYYGDKIPSRKVVQPFVDLNGDKMFLHGLYLATKGHAATSTQPVYHYFMRYETDLNVMGTIFRKYEGCGHGDDLGYLFKTFVTGDIQPGSREEKCRDIVTQLWTTFAKTGNPNPASDDPNVNVKWEPVTKDQYSYLDIGEPLKFIRGQVLHHERMKFWDELFATHDKITSKL